MRRFLGVTLFSGLLTLLRMGSGFLIAKAVALSAGPAGMAMLGQVQNLVTALNGIVTAPAGNGVVRYTAENYKDGYDACSPWWRASLCWMVALLGIVIPVTWLFSHSFADSLFGDRQYTWLVVVVGVALPLASVNVFLGSIINGLQQYKRFIGTGIVSVLVGTGFMLLMIVRGGLNGALLAAALFSAVTGLIVLISVIKQPWFRLRYWAKGVTGEQVKGIGRYVAMTATSTVLTPVSLIVIRNVLVGAVGWDQTGLWAAVSKISDVYLGILTIALSTYYLPRLAALKDVTEIRRETASVLKVAVPVAALAALIVYLMRSVALQILFTPEFRPAQSLFAMQLTGDVFKIAGWVLAYPLIAAGDAVKYIVSEILFSLLLVLSSTTLIHTMGLKGAMVSFAITYLFYAVCMLVLLLNRKQAVPLTGQKVV
jgi:PST family polysaccharide transporter